MLWFGRYTQNKVRCEGVVQSFPTDFHECFRVSSCQRFYRLVCHTSICHLNPYFIEQVSDIKERWLCSTQLLRITISSLVAFMIFCCFYFLYWGWMRFEDTQCFKYVFLLDEGKYLRKFYFYHFLKGCKQPWCL